MGRNRKQGLEYFPLDTDLFQDIRIRKLIKYRQAQAVTVYILLLSLIYREGYYIRWDDDLPFIIYEQTGLSENYIRQVITTLADVGLIHRDTFVHHHVITSEAIQRRYQTACESARRQVAIDQYRLLPTQKPIKNVEIPKERNPVIPKKEPEIPKYRNTEIPKREPAPAAQPKESAPSSPPLEPEEILSDPQWSAALLQAVPIDPKQLPEYIVAFTTECTLREKTHTSSADLRRHFLDWLRIQLRQQQQQPQATPTAIRRQEQRQAEEQIRREQAEKELIRKAQEVHMQLVRQGQAQGFQSAEEEKQWIRQWIDSQTKKIE